MGFPLHKPYSSYTTLIYIYIYIYRGEYIQCLHFGYLKCFPYAPCMEYIYLYTWKPQIVSYFFHAYIGIAKYSCPVKMRISPNLVMMTDVILMHLAGSDLNVWNYFERSPSELHSMAQLNGGRSHLSTASALAQRTGGAAFSRARSHNACGSPGGKPGES